MALVLSAPGGPLKKRNPEKFAASAAKLAELKIQARQGECQLIYYDEAGFAASPPVQRAWSPLGKPHLTTPKHHQRVLVMGALNFAHPQLVHQAAAELIDDGRNGRVVGPGDENAYVNAALQILGNSGQLAGMGEAARHSMLPRNWDNVVDRFESVAREAMQM